MEKANDGSRKATGATSDEPNIVKILAVGYKKGNTLFIVGKAVKL